MQNRSAVLLNNASSVPPSVSGVMGCAGIERIILCTSPEEAADALFLHPEITNAFFDTDYNAAGVLRLVKDLRFRQYDGEIVLTASQFPLGTVEEAVWAGVDGLLVRRKSNRYLGEELLSLLNEEAASELVPFSVDAVLNSLFMRTVGLSGFEHTLLRAYYPGCSSQKELAYRLNKSQSYIRKVFSGIYKKFLIENNAQLARLLTLCSVLCGRRNARFLERPS